MTKKIIMDCDPGHDDAIALILAGAKNSSLDVLAVTTVAGNQSVEKNTKNALNVLEVMGRGDINVSVGATRPLIKPASFASQIHGILVWMVRSYLKCHLLNPHQIMLLTSLLKH